MTRRGPFLGPALAVRLNHVMAKKELSGRALAKQTGINLTTIQALRAGEGGQAGISTVACIAHALGVKSGWLAFGTGENP